MSPDLLASLPTSLRLLHLAGEDHRPAPTKPGSTAADRLSRRADSRPRLAAARWAGCCRSQPAGRHKASRTGRRASAGQSSPQSVRRPRQRAVAGWEHDRRRARTQRQEPAGPCRQRCATNRTMTAGQYRQGSSWTARFAWALLLLLVGAALATWGLSRWDDGARFFGVASATAAASRPPAGPGSSNAPHNRPRR